MEDGFNVSSIYVSPWYTCNKQLEIYSSEGIVRIEISPQLAEFIVKISYSVATSAEGMTVFCCRSLIWVVLS